MKWWIKAFGQSFLAHLPMGAQAHEWLQLNYGELARLETTSRFKNAIFFLQHVRDLVGFDKTIAAVEIGTGWVPAVPMALLLAGAKVDTFDVVRLVRPEIFTRCLAEIGRRLPLFADAAGAPVEQFQARFDRIKSDTDFAKIAAALSGSYRAPFDTTHLPHSDASVDFVFSNLVFQNVHVNVLRALVRETWRVLRPGGIAVHRIGMQDEYASVDPDRGSVDFLRYSRSGWDFFCSHSIKYCNRLRCSQFIDLFQESGFQVSRSLKVVDREMIPRLRSRGVAAEFRNLSWEDLATTGLEIVLEKPLVRVARPSKGISHVAIGVLSKSARGRRPVALERA